MSCKESQEKKQDRRLKACRPTGYHKLLTFSGLEQRQRELGLCLPLLRKGSAQVGTAAIDGRLQINFAMDLTLNGCQALVPSLPTNGMFSSGGTGSVPVGVSRHAHTEFSVFSVKRNVLLQAGQRHPPPPESHQRVYKTSYHRSREISMLTPQAGGGRATWIGAYTIFGSPGTRPDHRRPKIDLLLANP